MVDNQLKQTRNGKKETTGMKQYIKRALLVGVSLCSTLFNVQPKISLKSVKMFQKMNQTKPRPKWKDEPSAQDRTEGLEKLQKLKDRHSFLRNPRFLPPNAQQGGTSLVRPRTKVGKTENVRKGIEEQRYLESVE